MTESHIQRAILDYLAAARIFAFRINTGAVKVQGRFFRTTSLGAGAADILALPMKCDECDDPGPGHGYHVPTWIEVKTVKGRQTPEQESFQKYVEGLGHKYILARSVDDVAGAMRG